MPWFKNISDSVISIVYNGRKVKIERGAKVEGPPHFKLYKGLALADNSPLIAPIVPMNKLKPIVTTSSSNENNNQRIENTINYIKNYKVGELPSVGICILTKNHLDLIRDCCESIFQRVEYKNTKIYILDTGTNQKDVHEYYKTLVNRKFPVEFVNMNYFHFSKNYNEGIKKVNTDFVVIQNNDTVAINDYVSRLMKIAIIGKVGACGPRMLYKNGTIQHDGQIIYNSTGTFAHPGHVNLTAPGSTPTGRFNVDGVTAAGLFINTELFRKIGGFDENFKDIYQDVHFNIKLKSLGLTNVCDRDAQIYHYDNTSRKELWVDKSETGKMAQDSKYLYGNLLVRDNALKNSGVEKSIDFSIITLTNDKTQYLNFLEDLKAQKFHGSLEIVALPNFNNEYSSCAEALNIGKDVSSGKYCIYSHQDLKVPSNWLENINSHIRELDMAKIGFLGMAGVSKSSDSPTSNSEGATYLSDVANLGGGFETLANFFRRIVGKRIEVQTLDELCIIGRKNLQLRFDEKTFDHYHWYGADICLQALSVGLKNYAIDADCLHISDGISNFKKKEHQEKFIEGSLRLFNKWKAKFPHFRSTTTGFSVPLNEIQFLFTKALMDKYKIYMSHIIKPN
jgi:GT2 family glycosyltransferase